MPIAIAIAGAVEQFFKFLCTPAGQQFCADVREGKIKLDQNMQVAWQTVQGWFKGLQNLK